MNAESGGEALLNGQPIVSRVGAMGLMQLMPGTWREMRAMLSLGSDAYNPADNILAGTAYLRLMYDRFGYPGLFAAYNAGPTRYAASLTGARSLPPETRAYVAAVVRAARRTVIVQHGPGGIFVATGDAARAAAVSEAIGSKSEPGLFVTLDGARTR